MRLRTKLLNTFPVLRKLLLSVPGLLPLPSILNVESSNMCMLRCVTCPTPGDLGRAKGLMSLEVFETLLLQLTWKVRTFHWTFAGEPLTNSNLFTMVSKAHAKGIKSKVDTNGMLLEKYVDEILDSKLHWINIALGGMNPESAASFRHGYDFETVTRGIRKLTKSKLERGAHKPIISINYVVNRQNESEMDEAVKFARAAGVDYLYFKSMNLNVGSDQSEDAFQLLADRFLPVDPSYHRYHRQNNRWMIPKNDLRAGCAYGRGSTTILWNGDVIVCCLDYRGENCAGNITKLPLASIWHSKKYRDLRCKSDTRSFPICTFCTSDPPMKVIPITVDAENVSL